MLSRSLSFISHAPVLHSSGVALALLALAALTALWTGSGAVIDLASPHESGPVVIPVHSAAEYQGTFDYVVAPLRRLNPSQVTRIVVTRPAADEKS